MLLTEDGDQKQSTFSFFSPL